MRKTINGSLDRDRLSVLLGVLALGSVLFRLIDLPERVWRVQVLGSPLEICVSDPLLLVVLMVSLVCAGTTLILYDHPVLREHRARPIYVFWILPAVLTGFSAYLLAKASLLPVWIGGLVLVNVGIGLTLAAEYASVSADASRCPRIRLVLNALAYVLAYTVFTLIYQTRTRSVVTATLTLLTAALLALDLLSTSAVRMKRVLLFAATAGLIIGESTWALNYWQVSAWAAGMLLLLIFYVTVNVAYQHLLERMNPSILLELAVVTVVVLAIILLRGF